MPDSIEPIQYKSPMDIFLSEKYGKLDVSLDSETPEYKTQRENVFKEYQNQRYERALMKFFQEGCIVKAFTMGIGGGVIGILFGSFFFTLKPMDVDTNLTFRQQMRQQYKSFIPEVTRTSKNFAKIGGIYSLVECIIHKGRATHDTLGAIYSGCVTGGLLAARGGVGSALGGCAAFGAFSGIMEKLQLFGDL